MEKQLLDSGQVQPAGLREALEHITEKQDKGLYGLCCYYIAHALVENGRTEESLEYLKECIRCMVGTRQQNQVSRGYHLLGVVAHSQNNLLLAMEQYNKALEYAQSCQDDRMGHIIHANRADVYYRLGACEKAFACCRMSIEAFERSGDRSVAGRESHRMLLAGYGYYLTMADRLKEAEALREKLLAGREETHQRLFASLCVFSFLALYSHRTGKDKEACSFLEEAVGEATARKRIAGDCRSVLNLLDLMVEMKQFACLRKALDWLEPIAAEENNQGLILQFLFYRFRYCREYMTCKQFEDCGRRFFRIQEERSAGETGLALRMLETCKSLWAIEEEKRRLEQEHLRLLHQVNHDELSGLYNKRCLIRYTDEIFDRAKRERKPVSILFIDIDYFKQLNDRYGHQAGDACIRAVAESIRESMPEDFAARYGGDEFVVAAFNRTEEEIRGGRRTNCGGSKKQENPQCGFPGGGRFDGDGGSRPRGSPKAQPKLGFYGGGGRNPLSAEKSQKGLRPVLRQTGIGGLCFGGGQTR